MTNFGTLSLCTVVAHLLLKLSWRRLNRAQIARPIGAMQLCPLED